MPIFSMFELDPDTVLLFNRSNPEQAFVLEEVTHLVRTPSSNGTGCLMVEHRTIDTSPPRPFTHHLSQRTTGTHQEMAHPPSFHYLLSGQSQSTVPMLGKN